MTTLSDLIYSAAAENLDADMYPDVGAVNIMPAGTGAMLTIAGGENGPRCRETGHQDYYDATELHGATLLEAAAQTTIEMSGAPATLDLAVDALDPITEWDTFSGEIIIDHRPQALRELARLLPGGGDSMRLAEVCLTRAAGFFRWRPPQHRTEIDYIRGGMELAEARRHLNDAFYHSAATGPYVGHVIALTEPMTPDQIRSLDLSEWQKNWDALEAIAKDARHEATRAFRRSNTAA